MSNDPNMANYQANMGVGRNRRSARHSGGKQPPEMPPAGARASYPDEGVAPLPLAPRTEPAPYVPDRVDNSPYAPPRREPPSVYEEASDRFPPRYDPTRQQEYDDYEEYDDAPRLWPKLLALVLALILLAAAALYFLVPKDNKGILGTLRGGVNSVVDGVGGLLGVKKDVPPTLIKFETPSESVLTGVKTYFTFTADSSVDEVRMFDDLGAEIIGQLSNADADKKVWSLAVVFDQPFDSMMRAEVRRGETWYPSDKTLALNVVAPTPTPPPLPPATLAPQPAVLPPVTDEPFVIPTDAPVAAVTNAPVVVVTDAPVVPAAAFVVPTAQPVAQAPVSTLVPLPTPAAAAQEPYAEEPYAEDDIIVYDDVQEDAPVADSLTDTQGATGAALVTQAPYVVLPGGDQQAGVAPVTVITAAPPMDEIPIFNDELPGQLPPAVATGDGVAQPVADPTVEGTADVVVADNQQPPTEPVAVAQEPEAPAGSPMPVLTVTTAESADPAKLKITDTVYDKAKKVTELARTAPVAMSSPAEYLSYDGGVFTFRNDSFRGDAAFGTADMPLKQLSVLWKAPLGSMRTSSGTLYGLGWTGQPAIVKWAKELRQMMNLNAVKKEVAVLKEVIAAGQDGKIYFFDLNDGVATRDPIEVGFPMKGSVAVDAAGQPMMAVGQGISQLPGKTGAIGLRLFDLITQKEMYLLNGRKSKTQVQYSTNGAFDGTPLFERNTGTLVVAGENGLVYTVALNTKFDYLDKHTIAVEPAITYLRSKTSKQADMSVTAEASVAMYGKYIYVVDRQGILRCIDSDTMKTVWAFDTGDNTDATPALGFDADGSLGLYTGTTVFSRTRRAGNALIRRMDALTGEEKWKVEVPAKYDQTERAGVKASPVVGQNSIQDLVIFTVNMTNDGKGATILALNKQTGAEVWKHELGDNAISSPVAVYNPAGDAYLIQADEKGLLTLLDARNGSVLYTLDLEGKIEASPAVYNDVLVIGTADKDNNFLYGIRLE